MYGRMKLPRGNALCPCVSCVCLNLAGNLRETRRRKCSTLSVSRNYGLLCLLLKQTPEVDFTMATTADSGEWQTVKHKEKSRKSRETGRKLPPTSVGLPSSITAFAALDKKKDEDARHSQAEGETLNDGSSERLEEDGKPTNGMLGNTLLPGKESKAKRPKAKKLTSSDDSANVPEADSFRATLKGIKEQHKYQEAMQLTKLEGVLRKSFKNDELQFSKMLAEGPLDKVRLFLRVVEGSEALGR